MPSFASVEAVKNHCLSACEFSSEFLKMRNRSVLPNTARKGTIHSMEDVREERAAYLFSRAVIIEIEGIDAPSSEVFVLLLLLHNTL